MEVDYCSLSEIPSEEDGFWLEMAVDRRGGLIMMHNILDQSPSVEDIVHLLASAMGCPHTGVCCRPETIFLRDNPEWEGLFAGEPQPRWHRPKRSNRCPERKSAAPTGRS